MAAPERSKVAALSDCNKYFSPALPPLATVNQPARHWHCTTSAPIVHPCCVSPRGRARQPVDHVTYTSVAGGGANAETSLGARSRTTETSRPGRGCAASVRDEGGRTEEREESDGGRGTREEQRKKKEKILNYNDMFLNRESNNSDMKLHNACGCACAHLTC